MHSLGEVIDYYHHTSSDTWVRDFRYVRDVVERARETCEDQERVYERTEIWMERVQGELEGLRGGVRRRVWRRWVAGWVAMVVAVAAVISTVVVAWGHDTSPSSWVRVGYACLAIIAIGNAVVWWRLYRISLMALATLERFPDTRDLLCFGMMIASTASFFRCLARELDDIEAAALGEKMKRMQEHYEAVRRRTDVFKEACHEFFEMVTRVKSDQLLLTLEDESGGVEVEAS